MPQFGLKTLLFAFVVGALWLSTSAGYPAAPDVQASIALVIFLAAVFAVGYSRGRRRAFWTGFLIAFLLMSCAPLSKMFPHAIPAFNWAPFGMERAFQLDRQGFRGAFVQAVFYQTARMCWVLALSAFIGFTATYIYDHAQKSGAQ
jgi:hypothetical protein